MNCLASPTISMSLHIDQETTQKEIELYIPLRDGGFLGPNPTMVKDFQEFGWRRLRYKSYRNSVATRMNEVYRRNMRRIVDNCTGCCKLLKNLLLFEEKVRW
jgi:hypothetical protein